jgi:hypothetical protein
MQLLRGAERCPQLIHTLSEARCRNMEQDAARFFAGLCRGAQGQNLLVPRPIPVHGLRAAHVPGEAAGIEIEPSRPDRERLQERCIHNVIN